LAVLAVRRPLDLAVFAVCLAPDLAVVAVLLAPDLAVVAVRRAVDRAVFAVRVALFLAARAVRCAPSVAAADALRTLLAVDRVVDEPRGDIARRCVDRIRVTRSSTAATPPCVMPLTVSVTRSTTPAMAPETTLAGGVSGKRG
jgi:hypothetical protein